MKQRAVRLDSAARRALRRSDARIATASLSDQSPTQSQEMRSFFVGLANLPDP
jgi:hypothetical protein